MYMYTYTYIYIYIYIERERDLNLRRGFRSKSPRPWFKDPIFDQNCSKMLIPLGIEFQTKNCANLCKIRPKFDQKLIINMCIYTYIYI